MLTLENVGYGYGPIKICYDLNLTIEAGEIVCLLGRNGMGKTTLLEGLVGLKTQKGGKIIFKGVDISRQPTHERARQGLSLVPQGRRVFAHISVRDNLRLGTLAGHASFQPIPDIIFEFFPILHERLDQKAQTLSGGEQQMLAIARSLAGGARFLLLDEPSEGLAPIIVDAIGKLIIELGKRGVTIFIAEQNLAFALAVAQRGYIIEKGRIVESGDVAKFQDDQIAREYLMV